MNEKLLLRGIHLLLGLRIAALSIAAFLPLRLPELWRQTDTLGVALRYWLRFTAESAPPPWYLPAVLNSGDTRGVMPMEAPVLNLLTSPAFAFGPTYGRALAILIHIFLCYGFTLLTARVWRGVRIKNIPMAPAVLLLPLASFTLIYFARFMPDYLSVILVLLAVGLSWQKNRPVLSFVVASIGLLMKPTSVVIFALYLLRPNFWRDLRIYLPWVFASVLAAALYYTFGLRIIDQYRETPNLFAVSWRPFLPSIVDFFSQPRDFSRLIFSRILFPGGILFVAGRWIYRKAKDGWREIPTLLGVFLLQLLAIAGLDGTHGYSHDYYFMGLAPTCTLAIVGFMQKARNRILLGLFMLVGVVPVFESVAGNLKFVFRPDLRVLYDLSPRCDELRHAHPELPWGRGQVFRAPAEYYPTVGLCFGERVGSATAPYGLYRLHDPLPAGCTELDRRGQMRIARCAN